ncbi:thiamine-phosphate kinase [Psychrobacter pygoscelis]|uniref:thiamine-phosphate kinase n=1 Tax=Psychrobacter pygoscelis TaxID=2488563 RepID=UPI0010396C69|nr:thiamine-phosphate kinase [Psychrobacter pygoscelis]
MTEFELIYRYFDQQKAALDQANAVDSVAVVKGLGDDAAVIAINAGSQLVSCVDTLVQGRHFSEDWSQVEALAFAIGFKSVAVNVSDLAAMGATPHHILLALALPERLATETWLSEFAKGLFHACSQFGVQLIGGDTTRNDKLVISITAQGFIANKKHNSQSPIYRNGAKVGDKVYVSGTVGDACYALHHPDDEIGRQLSHRLHMPMPRVKLGQALAQQGGATAMIDVSDGLVQDLGHICQQSGVRIRLNIDTLPTSTPLQQVALTERLHCQLTGGDDYELAFTLPAGISPPDSYGNADTANTKITCIGEVIDSCSAKDLPVIELTYQDSAVTDATPYPFSKMPHLQGFQHFN